MALTVTNSALRNELWRKTLFADVRDNLFMQKFIGSGESSMIHELTDLSANPGSKVTFGLGMKLSGAGTTGDSELEGNEESMTDYQETVEIDQLRHAVRLKGRMDEKQSAYKMRTSAKERLGDWWAERLDQELLDKLCGKASSTFSNTPAVHASTRKVFAGGVAADTDLTAAMKMDTKVLYRAKQMAMLASPKIRPLKINGKPHYVVIMHPYQLADLKLDPVWAQAQRDANTRGEDNPLFSGAAGVWDGLIIHEHEYVYTYTPSQACAVAVLCGQQAGVIAWGKNSTWVEEEFDLNRRSLMSEDILNNKVNSGKTVTVAPTAILN